VKRILGSKWFAVFVIVASVVLGAVLIMVTLFVPLALGKKDSASTHGKAVATERGAV
jgi:hypothetical protein